MVTGLTERLTFNGQKVDKNIISTVVSVHKVKAKFACVLVVAPGIRRPTW